MLKGTIEEIKEVWKFSKLEKDYELLTVEFGNDKREIIEKHILIYNKNINKAILASNNEYHTLLSSFSKFKRALKGFGIEQKTFYYFFKEKNCIEILNKLEIRKAIKKIKNNFGWSYNQSKKLIMDNFINEKIKEEKIPLDSDINIYELYEYKGIKVKSIAKRYYETIFVFNFGDGKDIFLKNSSIDDTRKHNKLHSALNERNNLSHLIYSFLYLEDKSNSFSTNSIKYKKLEKILISDKPLDEKYFLIKCFLAH
jgi:hypothetical protein